MPPGAAGTAASHPIAAVQGPPRPPSRTVNNMGKCGKTNVVSAVKLRLADFKKQQWLRVERTAARARSLGGEVRSAPVRYPGGNCVAVAR
jgi:hypothetical protein